MPIIGEQAPRSTKSGEQAPRMLGGTMKRFDQTSK
jgi:hypothetical protein